MKCPHCGNEVEVEVFLLKGMEKKIPMQPHEKLVKRESVQIHENEGGPPPDIPRGMPVEELNTLIMSVSRKPLSAAERAKAYRERRKLA